MDDIINFAPILVVSARMFTLAVNGGKKPTQINIGAFSLPLNVIYFVRLCQ